MKEKKDYNPMKEIAEELFSKVKTAQEGKLLLSDLYKYGIEAMLKAELDEHLLHNRNEQSPDGNYRNGTSKKRLKSDLGGISLDIPRDRNSSFSPIAVPKHKRMVDDIEDVVIGLYARGMNTRDIEDQIKDIYGISISETTVSNITASVIEYVREWQNRPLENVYYAIWMDALVFKVKDHNKIINKAVYLVLGLTKEGKKEVLGMWINPTESASFWMSVLTDLKARGVEDILIASTDNLKGFTEAIKATFPNTDTQLCIVHQVRNSFRFVGSNDKKEFILDLKSVYGATNLDAAENAFETFKDKWSKKYLYAVASWEKNWNELTAFFKYPLEIRKLIYTTNAIESMNSTIRKYTKTRTVFPDDNSTLKSVYLAINLIERKWKGPVKNWGILLNQFLIIFEDRCRI